MGPIRKLRRLPAADRALLARTVLWLGATRFALWLLPLRVAGFCPRERYAMIGILGRSAPPNLALAREMLAAAPHRGSCLTLRVLGNCVLGIANRPDFVSATVSSEGPVVAALSGRLDN